MFTILVYHYTRVPHSTCAIMVAGLRFSLFSILLLLLLLLLLFASRRHFHSNFLSRSTPNNVILMEEQGLYKDVRVKIFRIEFGSEMKVSFAVVRSAKHGVTSLALPAKPFMVDLTICVDVSPNPCPGFQNGSRISDNYESCVRPALIRMATHIGDCNNKLNYSRAQLVSLKKYATAFLPSQVITSLKQEGLLRTRGMCSGNLVRLTRLRKLWHMWQSISAITRPRRSKYDHHNGQASGNDPRKVNNLISVKISKPSLTLPKIIPSCMVINVRCLVKPDALVVLYTELHTHKIDLCFVSETWLNSKVASSLIYPDGYLIVRKDRCDLRTGGEVVIFCRNDWKIKRLDLQNDLERLWCEIITVNSEYHVAVVYHHPNPPNVELLDHLSDSCEQILSSKPNERIIIVGDINQLTVQDLMSQHNLAQMYEKSKEAIEC